MGWLKQSMLNIKNSSYYSELKNKDSRVEESILEEETASAVPL